MFIAQRRFYYLIKLNYERNILFLYFKFKLLELYKLYHKPRQAAETTTYYFILLQNFDFFLEDSIALRSFGQFSNITV